MNTRKMFRYTRTLFSQFPELSGKIEYLLYWEFQEESAKPHKFSYDLEKLRSEELYALIEIIPSSKFVRFTKRQLSEKM